MRIAIMTAGAVGGYFGGRLAAAGNDVTFIARGTSRIWRLFHDGVDAFRVAGLREPLFSRKSDAGHRLVQNNAFKRIACVVPGARGGAHESYRHGQLPSADQCPPG